MRRRIVEAPSKPETDSGLKNRTATCYKRAGAVPNEQDHLLERNHISVSMRGSGSRSRVPTGEDRARGIRGGAHKKHQHPKVQRGVAYLIMEEGRQMLSSNGLKGHTIIMHGYGLVNRIKHHKLVQQQTIIIVPWRPAESYMLALMDITIATPRLLPHTVIKGEIRGADKPEEIPPMTTKGRPTPWLAVPIGATKDARQWRNALARGSHGTTEEVAHRIVGNLQLEDAIGR